MEVHYKIMLNALELPSTEEFNKSQRPIDGNWVDVKEEGQVWKKVLMLIIFQTRETTTHYITTLAKHESLSTSIFVRRRS